METRKQQIHKAASEKYVHNLQKRGAFVAGASWADAHLNLESISHSLYETPNPRFHWIAIFYPYEDKRMPSIAISTQTDFAAIKALTPYGKWFYAKDLFPFADQTHSNDN